MSEKKGEYKKGNTKMFNIRVPEYLHSQFKIVAKERGVSMANLLLGYMERVVDGLDKPAEKTKENKDFDPLTDIRGQYRDGVDY
jgi:hypothetical protein